MTALADPSSPPAPAPTAPATTAPATTAPATTAAPPARPALALTSLEIHRLAGLTGGFALPNLSPGINVIFGPNGVGKSRTAWAIQLALWPADLPGRDPRDHVTARFSTSDSTNWLIDVDGHTVHWTRGGLPADAPVLEPLSALDRYHLPLQDLLAGTGANFADAILRESAGGYDLAAAARQLNIDHKPLPRTGTANDAVDRAARNVRDCQTRLANLQEEEKTLADLRARRDAARAAARRVDRLTAALAHHQAQSRLQQAAATLATFPPQLQQLTGTELPQLRRLRGDQETLQRETAETHRALAAAQAELAAAQVDADAERIHAAASAAARQVQEHRVVQQQLTRTAAEAAARLAEAARHVDPTADPAHLDAALATLDPTALNEVATLARDSAAARAAHSALQSELTALGPLDAAPADPQPLEAGASMLGTWLSDPEPAPPSLPWSLAVAAACVGVLAAVLALRVHPAWWAATLAAPLLFFLGLRPRTRSLRPVLESRFAATGLPLPATWTLPDVRAAVADLDRQLRAIRLYAEQHRRAASLRPRLADADASLAAVQQRQAAWHTRLGLTPPWEPAAMLGFVDALLRWRSAAAAASAAHAAEATGAVALRAAFDEAARPLRPLGLWPTNASELLGALDQLKRRCDQHRAAAVSLTHLQAAAAEQSARLAELDRRIAGLFAAVGLTPGDEATLARWSAARPDYQAAERALHTARAQAASAASAASALQDDATLATLTPDALVQELAAARDQAATGDDLNNQRVGIETRIQSAKQAFDLEAAQADCVEAAHLLRQNRDKAVAEAAGFVLVEHLRQRSHERDRPAVFRAAGVLFSRITRGAYRLEFDDQNDPPRFAAIDTATGRAVPIDALSAGTRVQLLLAVRLAFVDRMERGFRLPLLLDETLANSDAVRGRQVVDAVLEIARSGRQVFYFTSQADEVAQWRGRLQGTDSTAARDTTPGAASQAPVPSTFIDLAAVRHGAAATHTPLRPHSPDPLPQVPPPGDLDHAAYGQLLNVPGIDPAAFSPPLFSAGFVHLWHLIDDLPTLHRLLSRGVSTWGQWETLLSHTPFLELPPDQQAIHARARLLSGLAKLWRIGRGRPLDAQTLIESGAISDPFLPKVTALAATCDWNAARLLDALTNKAVPKFRTKNIDDLRDYLTEAGYLDPRAQLTPEDLWLNALALADVDLAAGRLSEDEVCTLRAHFAGPRW